MVAYFSGQGWSASRIAERLQLSTRQVHRLRKEMREHPERLAPKPPPAPEAYTPPAAPAKPRKLSRAQQERRQQQADAARYQRIFGSDPPPTAPNADVIDVPRVRPVSLDREW